MHNGISGFPELLPKDQIVFDKMASLIKKKFESYGFTPLDTPAVERVQTLLSKGNDPHEIYGLCRLADEDSMKKKELALRFDLTVPFARYVGQNQAKLNFPYRRYQIAPVWRGERPQSGRYRQFQQCDIDIVDYNELSLLHDVEILRIVRDSLMAIGITIQDLQIKLNNRKILCGLLLHYGVLEDQIANVVRVIDKIHKITTEQFGIELNNIIQQPDITDQLISVFNKSYSNLEWLEFLSDIGGNDILKSGVQEIAEVLEYSKHFGIEDVITIDLSLARGLNYYTGSIIECIWLKHPELGSICGGGRYANLVASFGGQKLPGVGVSIGISRLLIKMIEMGYQGNQPDTTAAVLVTAQDRNLMSSYIEIADLLRASGINTELYLQNKPLNTQMKYAGKKGFQYVIIISQDEVMRGTIIVRNMKQGVQTELTPKDCVTYLIDQLS